eukprot:TRINITY_DN958_c0_g1_i4.p1 TRINITY_DN958_c0_g1~~TRINITY_DN958_c0_g1_i4.p1  ORF type:complete len:109 (-),score=27.32 TRINITY_DN958_c0_g1_i4:17-301(-)
MSETGQLKEKLAFGSLEVRVLEVSELKQWYQRRVRGKTERPVSNRSSSVKIDCNTCNTAINSLNIDTVISLLRIVTLFVQLNHLFVCLFVAYSK